MSRLKTFFVVVSKQQELTVGNVYKGLDTAPSRTATRLRVVLKTSLEPFEAQSLELQRLHSAVVHPMNKVY